MPGTRVAAFILDFRIGLTFKVALKAVAGAVAHRAFDGAWRREASPRPAPEKGFPETRSWVRLQARRRSRAKAGENDR
jgi:hypothetical protein